MDEGSGVITKAPLKALRGAGTLRKQSVTARRARQPTHSLNPTAYIVFRLLVVAQSILMLSNV